MPLSRSTLGVRHLRNIAAHRQPVEMCRSGVVPEESMELISISITMYTQPLTLAPHAPIPLEADRRAISVAAPGSVRIWGQGKGKQTEAVTGAEAR
eukprot:CAMPEP_0117672476 /NCGR_PEP_ID=MMETSP0804-20121206/13926_1 /TAXON_ID=1074897 /ORGANISM="Tetraselmis astigmatica, Strain CCMP880" /LENGTH=95 /DNA_ID=CAMNT_0005481083 /DNA_START=65 /DNA_END=349 /DNA_ORIENTATION=+